MPDEAAHCALAIHGGRSDLSTLDPILIQLRDQGICSLSFNMSGHNKTVSIPSSIEKNIHEALAFAKNLKSLDTIIGYSLGGYIALKVAQQLDLKNIILFCPAVYSDNAIHALYGEAFKQAISAPFSYAHSSMWSYLEKFDGHLVVLYGEYDGQPAGNGGSKGLYVDHQYQRYSPIPEFVVQQFESICSMNPDKRKFIKVAGADHHLASFFKSNPLYI